VESGKFTRKLPLITQLPKLLSDHLTLYPYIAPIPLFTFDRQSIRGADGVDLKVSSPAKTKDSYRPLIQDLSEVCRRKPGLQTSHVKHGVVAGAGGSESVCWRVCTFSLYGRIFQVAFGFII
jgi:hypothetical protein